jgi:tripartite-type tricarboxylate transporter receptor subunit TctC
MSPTPDRTHRGSAAHTARRALLVSVAILALVGALAGVRTILKDPGTSAPTAATAPFPTYNGAQLQPLPDGFPTEALTLVNVDDAGSRDGLFARDLERALSDIVPVPVVVSDEPRAGGGTFHALADTLEGNHGAAGYEPVIFSIPGAVTDFHVDPIADELGRDLDDVSIIAILETQPFLFVQRSDAPWPATFQGFIDYTRAHPGEVRYIAGNTGSGLDIAMEWLLGELGIEVRKIPSAGSQAAISTLAAGEADISMSVVDVVAPAVQTGLVDVIWTSGDAVPDPFLRDGVACAADGTQYGIPDTDWGVVMALAVPAEVDDAHVEWLQEAFRAATETELYAERERRVAGLDIAFRPGAEADALARRVYKESEQVIRDLGLHWRDR